jgi:uncharacterized protein (DUF885 family)
VVDTALHSMHWTREQAIDWFHKTNGDDVGSITDEVDRYCVMPGQACGYMVGRLEILRLRDKAKAALGAKYDLRDYDDAVVLGGNVPMDVLALNVDDYIRRMRGA